MFITFRLAPTAVKWNNDTHTVSRWKKKSFNRFSILFASCVFVCSVPTFKNLAEETLIKIADVLDEVRTATRQQ